MSVHTYSYITRYIAIGNYDSGITDLCTKKLLGWHKPVPEFVKSSSVSKAHFFCYSTTTIRGDQSITFNNLLSTLCF